MKLQVQDIKPITERLAQNESLRTIAADFNVSYQTIWKIKRGEHSLQKGRAKRTQKPIESLAGLPADEIAARVEQEIKSAARKWRRTHGKHANIRDAAIATAALYLSKHHELYFREERQSMKDVHQQWMLLMQEWFYAAIGK